jgi:hypothetical protein
MNAIFTLGFLFAIFFLGCATPSYQVPVPIGEEKLLIDPAPGIARMKIRRIPVEDPKNLKAMVENRRNYRIEFFRQSKDPYFGKNRWSESCLSRNITGPLVESSDGFLFRSSATADAKFQTEVCLAESIDVVQIIGECRRDGFLFELTVELTSAESRARNLKFRCPDKVLL